MTDGFEKTCGKFSLSVSPPSPQWVKLIWEGRELWTVEKWEEEKSAIYAHIRIEDLHDLKYLIERAFADVGKADG